MTTPTTSRRRRALLAAVPHPIAAIPTITLLIAAADRLPDPLASHFGPSGTADGFAGRWSLVALAAGLGIGMAVVFALTAATGMGAVSRRDLGRWLVGLSWATAGFVGTVQFAATAANLDLADPATAALPLWTFPAALLIGAAAGLLGWLVTPRTTPSTPDDPAVPAVALGPTERVSWSRTAGSPVLLLVAGVLAAAAIALWVAGLVVSAVVMVAVAVLALVLGSARVTVDRRGLTVALGMLGWPRLRIPADDIVSVTVTDVSPMQYGGWGYRVLPGARGVILRSGEALVVTRRSGQRFAVTVDDAGTAAGLLAGIAARN